MTHFWAREPKESHRRSGTEDRVPKSGYHLLGRSGDRGIKEMDKRRFVRRWMTVPV